MPNIWPCSGWGLPSHPGYPGCWWSLTPPFHPYLCQKNDGARPSAVCSLWHFPSDHSDWPLASTLPCGAPTFLDDIIPKDPSPRSPSRLTVERPLCPIISRTGSETARYSAQFACQFGGGGVWGGRIRRGQPALTVTVPDMHVRVDAAEVGVGARRSERLHEALTGFDPGRVPQLRPVGQWPRCHRVLAVAVVLPRDRVADFDRLVARVERELDHFDGRARVDRWLGPTSSWRMTTPRRCRLSCHCCTRPEPVARTTSAPRPRQLGGLASLLSPRDRAFQRRRS